MAIHLFNDLLTFVVTLRSPGFVSESEYEQKQHSSFHEGNTLLDGARGYPGDWAWPEVGYLVSDTAVFVTTRNFQSVCQHSNLR